MRTILAALATLVAVVLLVPLLVLILPFWLVSVLTRMVARIAEPEFLTRDQLIQFDPVFGWRARPNLDTNHLMVDLFHIRTDNDGWRGKRTLAESDVVVFGDSFAAGYGVSDRHFFANLPSSHKIKSVGIGGYSMVQEFLWMEKLKDSLQGKLVIWFIYYGNDLYDNLMPDLRGYRKPFVREVKGTNDWEIVSSHVTPDQWSIIFQGRMQGQHHIPKLGELCGDTFLARRAFAACEFLLSRGKTLCDETGAELAVLGVPDNIQLSSPRRQALKAMGGEPPGFDAAAPDKKIDEICSALGVTFLAGSTFLAPNCYKINDCHWNETGHRKVLEAIEGLARSRGSKLSPRPVKAAAFAEPSLLARSTISN
ncbi:MAG TPA: SGNH/GDSL hydrolase family protein [Chthoniobacterales bacterium]|nr:SGNH/GDSL hydrolase family protein [Chthoniobacterales bacterium]